MPEQTLTDAAQILILTNDANQELALSEFLRYDYAILTARQSEEAAELFAEHQHQIRLLLTDLKTLKKTGLDLLTRAKQQYSDLPVLIIKPVGSLPLSENVVDRKILTYLREPYEYEQLQRLIARLLEANANAAAPEPGQAIELIDLVQLYCISEAKVALTVSREREAGREQGNIYVEDGRITNALCGKDRGEDAFYTIMRWKLARFTLRYGVVAKYKEIGLPWESLLIEALNRENEPSRDVPELRPPMSRVAPAAMVRPPTEDGAQTATTLSPSVMAALQQALTDLVTESDDIFAAILLDHAGHLLGKAQKLHAPELLDAAQTFFVNAGHVSEDAARALDLGTLDETLLLSDTGLMLLYPMAAVAFLGVISGKENQGMIRWNCRETLETLVNLLNG